MVLSLKNGRFLVEVTGLEPAASCSQSKRATNCATPRNVCISGQKVTFSISGQIVGQNDFLAIKKCEKPSVYAGLRG